MNSVWEKTFREETQEVAEVSGKSFFLPSLSALTSPAHTFESKVSFHCLNKGSFFFFPFFPFECAAEFVSATFYQNPFSCLFTHTPKTLCSSICAKGDDDEAAEEASVARIFSKARLFPRG